MCLRVCESCHNILHVHQSQTHRHLQGYLDRSAERKPTRRVQPLLECCPSTSPTSNVFWYLSSTYGRSNKILSFEDQVQYDHLDRI